MTRSFKVFIAVLGIAVIPALSHANARLISVVPVSGGCVSGPTGPGVQAWDVEPGQTYLITLADVPDCAGVLGSKRRPNFDGAIIPPINVRVNSSSAGNTDLVAYYVAPGVYAFEFTVPVGTYCTMPVFYCTVPGNPNTGHFVVRDDGAAYQAHLRAATFYPGCTAPQEIVGDACGPVATDNSTWGRVKALYR
jgi:hypothetical protein